MLLAGKYFNDNDTSDDSKCRKYQLSHSQQETIYNYYINTVHDLIIRFRKLHHFPLPLQFMCFQDIITYYWLSSISIIFNTVRNIITRTGIFSFVIFSSVFNRKIPSHVTYTIAIILAAVRMYILDKGIFFVHHCCSRYSPIG